jgi:TIR domain-containing protein
MRVFVSWSGDLSRDVATAIQTFLPGVIQAVDVFLSSEDIQKGSQWFQELGTALEEADFGILCLTSENLAAPWILYEAGAISKRVEQSRVVPLLIGLTIEDLAGPLAQFNAAAIERGEIARLVSAINGRLGRKKLSEPKLTKAFETWWPGLEDSLRKAAAKAAAGKKHTYDVFLSAPMAAYRDDAEFKSARADIKKVFDALTRDCGLKVFWAAEKIESIDAFDSADVSVSEDLLALERSRSFVLIYPQKLASSALFEAGYALALKRPSHYFVRDREDLPFLLRELPGSVPMVHIHENEDWKSYEDLAAKVKKHKDAWFPG